MSTPEDKRTQLPLQASPNHVDRVDEVYGLNGVDEVDQVDGCQQELTKVDESQRELTAVDENQRSEGMRFEGDLTAEIREWVKESTGSFTVADIDREFGLTLRRDKQRRSTALKRIYKENLIIKDRRRVATYHIVTTDLDFIDLKAEEEEPLRLSLPLGLDQVINIPPKAVIVLAGSSNSGKTCFALNLLHANMGSIPLLYLMSEMGPTEYRQRVSLFGEPLDQWQKHVKAAPLSAGFDGAIKQHNPNGLTIVDYLEDIEGEYYKIASDIRGIYDALSDGVAFICLQKRQGALYGRGGEATQEKARLYLTLDTLLHKPGFTIAALRIGKAKSYPGENPNGKERHFRIIRGHKIEPVSGWMFCNERQRAAWVVKYQNDEKF